MKLLKNLTTEELKLVYENNDKVDEQVFELLLADAWFWINEYTACFERDVFECTIDYPGEYIFVNNNEKFIDGCKEAQRTFELFDTVTLDKVLYCEKLFDKANNIPWEDEKNTRRLEARIEELCEEIADALLSRLRGEYDSAFDDENQIDYFINYAWDIFDGDNFYIDDDYILYEKISYIKSYA